MTISHGIFIHDDALKFGDFEMGKKFLVMFGKKKKKNEENIFVFLVLFLQWVSSTSISKL